MQQATRMPAEAASGLSRVVGTEMLIGILRERVANAGLKIARAEAEIFACQNTSNFSSDRSSVRSAKSPYTKGGTCPRFEKADVANQGISRELMDLDPIVRSPRADDICFDNRGLEPSYRSEQKSSRDEFAKDGPNDILKWLEADGVGMASKAIVLAALGAMPLHPCYPHDLDGLKHCYRILGFAPWTRRGLEHLGTHGGDVWSALVKQWDAIEAEYLADSRALARGDRSDLRSSGLLNSVIESAKGASNRVFHTKFGAIYL